MRIRTIKPEFWQHEMHGKISETAALLAVALLNYADDEGRFKVQFAPIRSLLFTHRDSFKTPLQEAFEELKRVWWVFTYRRKVDDQEIELGQITTFRRHQRIDKPQKSRLPEPHKNEFPNAVAGGFVDDSGNAPNAVAGGFVDDSNGKEGKEGKEGKGKEGVEGVARAPEGSFVEPTLEEAMAYGDRCGVGKDCCEKFFYENKAAGWMDRRNRPVVDWRSGLMAYAAAWRSSESERKNRAGRGRPDVGSRGSGSHENHAERKGSDHAEWWMMPVTELRDLAMSLAKSSEQKNKTAAARVAEVIGIREKEGAR